ncbi:acylase [Desulforhopalus sp. 52FAK]
MGFTNSKNFISFVGDVTAPLRFGLFRQSNVMIAMRDGVALATDIYRPLNGGALPAILIRTTYGSFQFNGIKLFVDNGYAVIVQDVRGRYASEGESYSPHRYSRNDGFDTISWIVEQKWSSGKVGSYGCSYLGESQIVLAAANHPNHMAMIAEGAGGAIGKAKNSYGYFGVYENGVLNLASALGWFTAEGAKHSKITKRPPDYAVKMQEEMNSLPISQLARNVVPYETGFDDFVSHKLTDSWWEEEGYIDNNDTFSAAVLHVNTWYDQTVHDTFRLAEHLAENAQHPRAKSQHVLIDPGNHCSAGRFKKGPVQVGEMAFNYKEIDFSRIYLDWFDYWLKGKKVDLPPRFKYFLIHGNSWKTAEKWPPPNVKKQRYYLDADGFLGTGKPESSFDDDSSANFDSYVYDPLNPVPTRGGSICCTKREGDISGAVDQRPLKERDDVLIYTSDALKADLDLTGNVTAVLNVSTTALDTDFTVKIVDQYPDGKAFNLHDGVIRLRYREGINKPKLAEPEAIYKIELELRPIAYRFKKGHKIAVYISSSNFPRLARNLNTGAEEYNSTVAMKAENRLYRSLSQMSYVDLPIVVEKKNDQRVPNN